VVLELATEMGGLFEAEIKRDFFDGVPGKQQAARGHADHERDSNGVQFHNRLMV
jgi:hypothetical protein